MKFLFEKYRQLKDVIRYDYNGYQIQNLVALELIKLVYNPSLCEWSNLKQFFAVRKIDLHFNDDIVFSIGPYQRKDYYELLDFVRSYNSVSSLIDLSEMRFTIHFSLKNIVRSLALAFRKKVTLNIEQRLVLAASITRVLNTIDYLEKQPLSKAKVFCSFCSNLTDEGILDYYFQKQGLETYTLQHGLWFVYEDPPIDAITYENLLAKKLLCWGQYTNDEYKKFGIAENKLFVSGYPRECVSLLPPNRKHSKLKALVLLARSTYDLNNSMLLECISKVNIPLDVEVKLHPSLIVESYCDLIANYGFKLAPVGTVKDLLESNDYDLTLTYNSTAYYDSYINNCISFRFKDVDADNSINVLDDSFSDEKELQQKLSLAFIADSNEEPWNIVTKRLQYIMGFGINNYELK